MGMDRIAFRPRRLGHVNLYVGALERSLDFYQKVCGIELVRLEPGIRGGFHSNGNTHHDIGLIEVSHGVDRRGRDGKIQIAASRGTRPGLNHLGWEMEDEAELVAAYERMRAAGLAPMRLSDHLISHSVYVSDPDDNVHEFYADAIPDWRRIFNLDHDDLVTAEWDPLAGPPSPAKNYPVAPAIRHVAGAALQPVRITGATLATPRFEAMHGFLTDFAGLTALADASPVPQGGPRRAVLAGQCGRPDLTLVEVAAEAPAGLRLFSFLLAPGSDLAAAARHLAEAGAARPRLVEDDRRQALVVDDPDGFRVEFYRPRSGEAVEPLAA